MFLLFFLRSWTPFIKRRWDGVDDHHVVHVDRRTLFPQRAGGCGGHLSSGAGHWQQHLLLRDASLCVSRRKRIYTPSADGGNGGGQCDRHCWVHSPSHLFIASQERHRKGITVHWFYLFVSRWHFIRKVETGKPCSFDVLQTYKPSLSY